MTIDNGLREPSSVQADQARGRTAETPTEIPGKGWKDVFARVRKESKDDGVSLLSAGVAFYGLLAFVPGLVALVSLYGLVAKPSDVQRQVSSSLSAAPKEVRGLVTSQLQSIVNSAGKGAVLGVIFGTLLALWSASSGIGHLIEAVNRAYDEQETRGFVKRKAIALMFTIGAILFVLVAFGLVTILPALLAKSGLGTAARVVVGALRWIVLLGGMIVGLAVLYRFGPDRDDPRWRWVTPGAVVAAVAWIIGSLLFSLYTANFAKYNETYGSLGAVVIMLLWLFLTAAVVIMGAEINAELERQTTRDTTVGGDQPMGQRSALAADTVGETADQVSQSK
ncbi:MAG TPA: YihY/virulence factor BrkB family protein [Ilumatobacteraceae bacterium]|nr:YihY/virulence factor BrkB family protein [Ilumatobacteraceae bacterium]